MYGMLPCMCCRKHNSLPRAPIRAFLKVHLFSDDQSKEVSKDWFSASRRSIIFATDNNCADKRSVHVVVVVDVVDVAVVSSPRSFLQPQFFMLFDRLMCFSS